MENSTGLTYYCDNHRHLICTPYTEQNLHLMASELGIARCWYHSKKYNKRSHYDIPKMRIAEITAKCNLITSKELLKIIQDAT